MWIINLIKTLYCRKQIDTMQFNMILDQIYKYRDGFAMLYVYDWVKIPLVYTQVSFVEFRPEMWKFNSKQFKFYMFCF